MDRRLRRRGLLRPRDLRREVDECEDGRPLNLKSPAYPSLGPEGLPTAVRCKKKLIGQTWEWTEGLVNYDFLGVNGAWKVCYYPYGGGITSVRYRYWDVIFVEDQLGLWEWVGDEEGYPRHFRDEHVVTLQFRGKIHLCFPWPHICAPMVYTWLTYVFRDTGLYGSVVKTAGHT